jgi:hypothetical protein
MTLKKYCIFWGILTNNSSYPILAFQNRLYHNNNPLAVRFEQTQIARIAKWYKEFFIISPIIHILLFIISLFNRKLQILILRKKKLRIVVNKKV